MLAQRIVLGVVCIFGLIVMGIINDPYLIATPPYPPDTIDHLFMRFLKVNQTSFEYRAWSIARFASGTLIFGIAAIHMLRKNGYLSMRPDDKFMRRDDKPGHQAGVHAKAAPGKIWKARRAANR